MMSSTQPDALEAVTSDPEGARGEDSLHLSGANDKIDVTTETGNNTETSDQTSRDDIASSDEHTAVKLLDDAAHEENTEHDYVTEINAQHLQDSTFGRSLLQRERVDGNLKVRSKQAVIHLAFTEMRITALEKELKELRYAVLNLPEDLQDDLKRRGEHNVYQNCLVRSSLAEFQISSASFDIPTEQRPALQVLIEEQLTQPDQSVGHQELKTLPRQAAGVDGGRGTDRDVPRRLRIRPYALLAHLARITGESIPCDLVLNQGNDRRKTGSSVVFLRPFKVFVRHEAIIRRSAEELKLQIRQMKRENDKDEEAEKQQKSGPESARNIENEELLSYVGLLVDFIDVDLQPTLDLRAGIKHGTITEIEYDDLWHLFERGEFVVSRTDKHHAYRVISFTGGREILIDRMHGRDDKVRTVDGFTVDCYSIGYNGTRYIPQRKSFSIRKFPGRQQISSLPIYPLRFDSNAQELRERFHDQGVRFLDLTRAGFCHKMLNGKTLDEPSHDIEAQVIVDQMPAATGASLPESQKLGHISEDDVTEADVRETYAPPHCYSRGHAAEGCCGSDLVFKDLSIDKTNTREFIRVNAAALAPRTAEELKEDELILLPHWVHGFVLRSRQWITMRTGDLSEVKFENDLDELVLPPRHKATLQALVETHESARMKPASGLSTVGASLDLIKGKGSGLIILLHGEPGESTTMLDKVPCLF